ncbi:TIM barrel protein [Halobacteria archaeon AArc-dxtr1]|nr:TIM barrel protein [Halobacteria archaeon AArc-dxtr1]
MSDSQQQSTSDRAENSGGSNRRTVLQGIGAAGVAGAVAGKVSADGQSGQFSQAAANVSAQDDDAIPTGSQFWSFASNIDDDSNVNMIELSGENDLHTYEPFSVGPDTDQDEIDDMLDAEEDAGVYMSSAHIGIGDVFDSEEDLVGVFEQFESDDGYPALIDPSYGGTSEWSDEDEVIEWAQECNEAADILADHDMEFGYHNHDWEFTYLDGSDEYGYDLFLEEVEDHVHVQLDVAWCFAGEDRPDPLYYLTEYGDQINSLHMKNWEAADNRSHGSGEMGNGDLTEIHEGDLNMRAIATAARNASDVEYLIYEYDQAPNPEESFEYAGYWLNKINHPWDPAGICAIEDADTHPAKLH